MISDSYDLKLVDDIVYEADCAMITEGKVDVGQCLTPPCPWAYPSCSGTMHIADTAFHPVDIGANASAEEAEEALDDQVTRVNNIVHSFRLQSTSFDKKSYLAYLKGMQSHNNL